MFYGSVKVSIIGNDTSSYCWICHLSANAVALSCFYVFVSMLGVGHECGNKERCNNYFIFFIL